MFATGGLILKNKIHVVVLSIVASAFLANGANAETDNLAGDLTLYGGILQLDDDYDPDYSFTDGGLYGLAARLRFDMSAAWTGQGDVTFEHVETGANLESYDEPYSVANLAFHGARHTRNGLIGGFASIGVDGGWWDDTFYTVGAEGKGALGDLIVYGQVGRTTSMTDGEDKANFFRLETQSYLSYTVRVGANLGIVDMRYGGDDKIDTTTCGLDVEYFPPQSNYSLFASYQGSLEKEVEEDEKWSKESLTLGFRMYFGNRASSTAPLAGATLSDFNPFTGAHHVRYSDYE